MAKELNGLGISLDGATQVVYTDEWMGDAVLTVTWETDRHKDLKRLPRSIDYGGDTFTMKTSPSVKQQSGVGAAVNSFVTTAKYYSVREELKKTRFLDYVGSGSDAMYSALPDFSFWCENVNALLERIKANLDRSGYKGWTFEYDGSEGKTGVNISVNNISCWDALQLVNSELELDYVIAGRNVKVSSDAKKSGISLNYGRGNGLYSVEESYDDTQTIITKLYAFGNTTNLPNHYYMNMHLKCMITRGSESHEINVIPPLFSEYFTMIEPKYPEEIPEGADPTSYPWYGQWLQDSIKYRDAYEAALSSYEREWGTKVRELCGIFGITQSEVNEYIRGIIDISGTTFCWTAQESIRPYNVRSYRNTNLQYGLLKVDGEKMFAFYSAKKDKMFFFGDIMKGKAPGTTGVVTGVDREKWPNVQGERLPQNINCSRLMLPEFGKLNDDGSYTLDVFVGNPKEGNVIEDTVVFDGSDGRDDIYPSIKYVKSENGDRLDIVSGYEDGGCNKDGVYKDGEKVPNFYLTIPNIGFDISDYVEETPYITINEGMCAGRSFEIYDVDEIKSDDKVVGYKLMCKRTGDNGIYFPNGNFPIKPNEEYVLTGIAMPDEYVQAAAEELKRQAEKYLKDNNTFVRHLTLEVDPDAVASGAVDVSDIRAGVGIVCNGPEGGRNPSEIETMVSIVDSLTITYSLDSVPRYDIQLSDEKKLTKLQSQLSQKEQIMTNGAVDAIFDKKTDVVSGDDDDENYVYAVKATASSIRLKDGEWSPASVNAGRYKRAAGGSEWIPDDQNGYFFFRVDDGAWFKYYGPVPTATIKSGISFRWSNNSNGSEVIDEITIPLIEDGTTIQNLGEWHDDLFVPYMSIVRFGGASYQCIAPEGTTNPPVKLYATSEDEVLTYEDGGYVLSDEISDEYRMLAKDGTDGTSANALLTLGLSEKNVKLQGMKAGSSYEVFADTEIRVSVVATYDNEDITPDVVDQSVMKGCTYSGTQEVVIRIPKGTKFRNLANLYKCTLSFILGGRVYEQECVVRALVDTSFMQVQQDLDKIMGEMHGVSDDVKEIDGKVQEIGSVVTIVKDSSGKPTGDVRIGSLTISKNEISITDSNKNKAIIVPNIENGGGMKFCPSAPNTDCKQVPIGDMPSGGGGILTPSDMRIKNDIEDIELDVDQIADAPIFNFTFDGSPIRHSGTSAQYWQKVLPNVVRGDDMLMMEYAQAAMVAVVSLARKVRALERKLNERQ